MPLTVTTKELLVASTAKLLAMLMVGVVPKAVAGVEAIPLIAKLEMTTVLLSKPNKFFDNKAALEASVLGGSVSAMTPGVMLMLDLSPVVPDSRLNILFTESNVTFMP